MQSPAFSTPGVSNSASTLTLTYLFLDSFPLLPAFGSDWPSGARSADTDRRLGRGGWLGGQNSTSESPNTSFSEFKVLVVERILPFGLSPYLHFSGLRGHQSSSYKTSTRSHPFPPTPIPHSQRSAIFPAKTTPLWNNWNEGRRGEGLRKTRGDKDQKISSIPLPDAVPPPMTTFFCRRCHILFSYIK